MKSMNNSCGKKRGCNVDTNGLPWDNSLQSLNGSTSNVSGVHLSARGNIRAVGLTTQLLVAA